MLKQWFVAARLAALLALAPMAPASAAQDNLFSPTIGIVNGLALTNNYNNAIKALASCNSGTTAPANLQTGIPIAGQCWLDTTSATRLKKYVYSGSAWVLEGVIDVTNGLWLPQIGGGAATIASGATVNLGSVPDGYISITGNTTITAFGTPTYKGAKFIEIVDGLVLTHNSVSLRLPGSANITAQAGSSLLCYPTGGANWSCRFFQQADGSALTGTAVALTDHGKVKLANTGQPNVLEVQPYNGNGLYLYCSASSQYSLYRVPNPIRITSVANNGSGAVRLTLASGARTIHTGEWVNISDATGLTSINANWQATAVDNFHIDLQGSTYGAGYVANSGFVHGALVGDFNSIRYNGVNSQVTPKNTYLGVFARWADAGCTYAEMSVLECSVGCYQTPSLNGTSLGFPIDTAGGGGDNSTLVGVTMKRDVGSGGATTLQGNAQYNLALSWYNRTWMNLYVDVTGNTGGTSGSYVELNNSGSYPGRLGFLTFADDTGGDLSGCFAFDMSTFGSTQTVLYGVGLNGLKPDGTSGYTVTGGGAFPPNGRETPETFSNSSQYTRCINLPVNNNIGGGYYEYGFWAKVPSAGDTLRSGFAYVSRPGVRAQF